jgi:spermidine synthase
MFKSGKCGSGIRSGSDKKCFNHLKPSSHFDDGSVELWFGDTTKSLLLLPEDYWGYFDLVLVDLSESAASFSVTTKLDVFDALSLILNPVGVMVKNERVMVKNEQPLTTLWRYFMTAQSFAIWFWLSVATIQLDFWQYRWMNDTKPNHPFLRIASPMSSAQLPSVYKDLRII